MGNEFDNIGNIKSNLFESKNLESYLSESFSNKGVDISLSTEKDPITGRTIQTDRVIKLKNGETFIKDSSFYDEDGDVCRIRIVEVNRHQSIESFVEYEFDKLGKKVREIHKNGIFNENGDLVHRIVEHFYEDGKLIRIISTFEIDSVLNNGEKKIIVKETHL